MPIQSVTCLGAGNVGRAWAIVFAKANLGAGLDVTLYDLSDDALDRARASIDVSLRDMAAANLIDDVDAIMARVSSTTDLEAAVAGADYIQESAPEDEAIKRSLYEQLSAMVGPETIVGSSTSEIVGSRFMGELDGNERFLVVHPVNPPSLIPFVELCPSPWTDGKTTDAAKAFMQDIGMQPIVLEKEIAGFVLNRLQFALLGEAMHLVGEGICGPDDIDAAVKHGLGLRWSFMGPYETQHLNADKGYADYMRLLGDMARAIQKDLKVDYDYGQDVIDQIDQAISERIPHEQVADHQAWRDKTLMAFVKHRKDSTP